MGRYGSGTLFQRGKKGIWYYQAYVNGKRIGPISSHSTDRKEAARELDKLCGRRGRGELVVTPACFTIANLLENYLEYADAELERITASEYRRHSQRHLIPAFGHLKPEQLTSSLLSQYRKRRSLEPAMKTLAKKDGTVHIAIPGRTVGQTSINRELAVLRAALNYALDMDKRFTFLVPRFPMPAERNVRKGFLTEDHFEQQFWQLPYWGVRAMAATEFYTGVRSGELSRVDWNQVDFNGRVITLYDTKNHDAREIPILDGLMLQSLREAKKEREECWPECQAVFAYRGKRLRSPKRSWRTAAKNSGLVQTRIHDLRRSANRNMRDMGTPQPIRMKIMGHLTDSMDRRYGIVDRTDLDLVRELHARKLAKREESRNPQSLKDVG